MRVRTASDLVYTLIAWLPIIAVAIGVFWVLGSGLEQLETISFGSEFFVGNDETTNLPPSIGPSNEQVLMDALATGDTEQMSAALDQVESRQQALATR